MKEELLNLKDQISIHESRKKELEMNILKLNLELNEVNQTHCELNNQANSMQDLLTRTEDAYNQIVSSSRELLDQIKHDKNLI